MKSLPDAILLRALKDSYAGVRENALIVAEEKLADKPEILAAALNLAHDPDARVRLQTALTLSRLKKSPDEKIQEALFVIAKQDALEQKEITLGEMNFHLERLRTLLFWSDENIRRRAQALFNDAGVVTRQEAIEKMRPALALQGDPQQGHAVYRELCAKCHRLGNEGEDLGPNLTEIFRKSAASLLQEIVDPNAAVETKYLSHVLRTIDGEFITGIVADETDADVTLCAEGGVRKIVRRDKIAEMPATGISMMPEQLEEGMTPQMMADLLAFLMQPR